MTTRPDGNDPIPPSAYPSLRPVDGAPPAMPAAWECVALLHPFSPPPSTDPQPDTPFFQLCLANIAYAQGGFLSAQIVGCEYGTWWYVVTAGGTKLSRDEGRTWEAVEVGWTLPSNWFGAQLENAACAGSSPLNWMPVRPVDWWKVPVPLPSSPPAATWMWFDSETNVPVRMMFGYGPPKPTLGDPTQLALFQMYSFTYVPVFGVADSLEVPEEWTAPAIPGFAVGNPDGLENFVWNPNFGFTALMTPVNERFNPLPTRILYVWKPDAEYAVASDRAQSSVMLYTYNEGTTREQEALLMGPAPPGTPPPVDSDTGFLVTVDEDGTETCIGGSKFPFPQEPPDWISIPAVQATIRATITDNPVLCPGETVTVYSVLFPPAPPNYPDATYLWTWYSPFPGSDGTRSRPVTFMQSQSGVGVGTSLALADYFYYEELADPIDPANFMVPAACAQSRATKGLRFALP